MGDSEDTIPASKKRVAGRQISKENPELDDDGPEPEMGTFQRASDEVLAARRIVKVRRAQPLPATSNPFATLRMVQPSDANTNSVDDKVNKGVDEKQEQTEEGKNAGADEKQELTKEGKNAGESGTSVEESNGAEDKIEKVVEEITTAKLEGDVVEAEKNVDNKDKRIDEEVREETAKEDVQKEIEEIEKEKVGNIEKDTEVKPTASLSSFQQLSSNQNAFTGLTGTGFGTSSFSFGSIAKEGPTFSASSESVFGFKSGKSSFPSFGAAGSTNGNLSTQPSITSSPSMKEVPIETGEENEKAVFTADAILYEYLDGTWKERGKGELKLNLSLSGAQKARLIMRTRGNYRLVLNASLYPDMVLTNMEKKGITFACINSAGEGKNGLTTFALKFKDSSFVEEFRSAVTAHKGKKETVLKTPENSPKASDE